MGENTELGARREVALRGGRVRYAERGSGPAVVFVHGLLVNGLLWRKVVPGIADAGYRCITPDWPLGAHSVPVPGVELSPPGVAALIAEFLAALELTEVTIVANDTGGAITQILLANHPERVGRVVLTPSDSYEEFFPAPFKQLPAAAKIPGMTWLLVQSLRLRAVQRLPIAFGWVSKRPLSDEFVDACLTPSRQDRAVRRDLRRFLTGVHRRHTLAAAQTFPAFRKPVLLAWAREDRFFPLAMAHRLARAFPDATLELIDDSYTFVPEDQPETLVRLVVNFLGARTATRP